MAIKLAKQTAADKAAREKATREMAARKKAERLARCKCRSNSKCDSQGHHSDWCYIDTLDNCSDGVQGKHGAWSVNACKQQAAAEKAAKEKAAREKAAAKAFAAKLAREKAAREKAERLARCKCRSNSKCDS